MTNTHCSKPIAFTALLCLSAALISCETTVGGSRVSSADPKIIQAKKEVLDSLGDMTVNNRWVRAERTVTLKSGIRAMDELQARLGRSFSPNISSNINTDTVHYSGWRLGEDNVLRARRSGRSTSTIGTQSAYSYSGEIEIPVLKTERVFIHDHEVSPELTEALSKEVNKLLGTSGRVEDKKELHENLDHTATVEFVLKGIKGTKGSQSAADNYERIYFPNRQRAQQFVDRWNHLVAVMRK